MELKELCSKCQARPTCKELCVEAGKYVNQDYTGRKESILKVPIKQVEGFPKKLTKSKEELIVTLFFIDRKKQKEIAEMLYISRPYVSKIVKKYKAILQENLKKQVNLSRK